jgi:hippurate hydrolase
VHGAGSHAAMPQQSRDPIVITSALVQQLQTIVSRNSPPTSPLVLSVTQFNAGSAYNVVPEAATIAGTIRYFEQEICDLAHQRIENICAGFEKAYGVKITVELRNVFDVLVNDAKLSAAYIDAAREIVGDANAQETEVQVTGSEDFADMLKVIPGAYCWVGHQGSLPLHNPGFVLDDGILPVGASIMARMVERRMPV